MKFDSNESDRVAARIMWIRVLPFACMIIPFAAFFGVNAITSTPDAPQLAAVACALPLVIALNFVRCPKCRKPFFRSGFYGNGLTGKCLHCGAK